MASAEKYSAILYLSRFILKSPVYLIYFRKYLYDFLYFCGGRIKESKRTASGKVLPALLSIMLINYPDNAGIF